MRNSFILVFLLLSVTLCAQDAVIGIGDNLFGHGNLIVSQSYKSTTAVPTAAQTLTMVNGSTVQFSSIDSTGRLFDTGGGGNYTANQNAVCTIPRSSQAAYQVTLEDVDLRTGDSLSIKSFDGTSYKILLAVGNGFSTISSYVFDNVDVDLQITFTSNADAAIGRGFRLLFKRLFVYSSSLPGVYPSTALVYQSSLGALRSGYTTNQVMGNYSSAFGAYNSATGYASFAAGYNSNSSGFASTASGYTAAAAGVGAAAVGGYNNYARGNYSFATGYGAYAHADFSFAAGYNAAATGNVSSAFGEGTLSASYVCMSLGKYNYTTPTSATTWITTDPILIVGNGTDANHRSNILEFYKNGNLGIHGSFYNFSDERLKTDIKPLENSLSKIQSINGYNYHWKSRDDDPGLQTGVLAQEIQKAFPELVGKNLKGELSVNYIGLIPHLIEAIKQLQQEISDLKHDSSNVAVCLCDHASGESLTAAPNPTTDHLTITLTTGTAGDGSLQIIDSRGQALKKMSISVHGGTNILSVSMPQLPAGEYQLLINWGNGMMKRVSVVKQ